MALTLEDQYDPTQFKLAAINILLQSIGEEPLTPDDDITSLIEAQTAEATLIEAKMAVLSEGWVINQDTDYEFMPDLDGFISVPSNVLDIEADSGDIIVRDWQLYSRKGQTRKFAGSVKCNVKWNLDFNTLTHPLRYYITIKAARIFQARMISDANLHRFSEKDEIEAKVNAKRSEGFTGQYNMLTSGHGLDFNVLG